MMKVLYLDLDGVLSDFIGGLCRHFGVSRSALNAAWPVADWNIHPALGMTEGDMWGSIDKAGADFWANLDWTPDGRQILDLCEQTGLPLVLMTSPPLNPEASAGKVAWIKKHLPKYARRFAITPCKELFAHPDALLVDDADVNVNKFRAAGGKAILVPRRWNADHDLAVTPGTVTSVRFSLLDFKV